MFGVHIGIWLLRGVYVKDSFVLVMMSQVLSYHIIVLTTSEANLTTVYSRDNPR